VKFHVGNIMRKLGVARRTEAVYAASKIGLV
jgi:two-component system, NarL family, response regulator DevR